MSDEVVYAFWYEGREAEEPVARTTDYGIACDIFQFMVRNRRDCTFKSFQVPKKEPVGAEFGV